MSIKSLLAAALLLGCATLPATARAGSVTIINNGYANNICREFTSDITTGNIVQRGTGTACQQGDGSWLVVAGPGTGTSFFDNGIPVAYPASNYLASQDGYYNNVYYGRPVYYQEPVRVRYVFFGAPRYRQVVYPAPVVVYPGRGHGYGNPYGRDYGRGGNYGHDYGHRYDQSDRDRGRDLPNAGKAKGFSVNYRETYYDPHAPQYVHGR